MSASQELLESEIGKLNVDDKRPSIAESLASATSSKSTASQEKKLRECCCSRKILQTCSPVFPACCNHNYFVPFTKCYHCCSCESHKNKSHKKKLSKGLESNEKPSEQQNECKCCSEKKCACCKSGKECDKEEDKLSEKNESDKGKNSSDEDEDE